MSRRKKKKSGAVVAVIVTILFMIIAGTGFCYVKSEYKAKQKLISEEISKLEVFNKIEKTKALINIYNKKVEKKALPLKKLSYPLPTPAMSPTEIQKMAKLEAENLTKAKYPESILTSKILNKYRMAKLGDIISFKLKTSRMEIKGIYRKFIDKQNGRFIKIDDSEYRLKDIMDDYLYLFDKNLADDKAGKMLRNMKTEKEEYFNNTNKKISEKKYTQSYYIKIDKNWIPVKEFIEEKLNESKKAFDKKKKKEIEKIYQKNKLLGLFRVSLPEENNDSKKDGLKSEEKK